MIGLAQPRAPRPSSTGNTYVTPQDIKAVAADILRHRLMPSYEAEAEGSITDALVARVLDHVPVP